MQMQKLRELFMGSMFCYVLFLRQSVRSFDVAAEDYTMALSSHRFVRYLLSGPTFSLFQLMSSSIFGQCPFSPETKPLRDQPGT